MLPQIAPAPFSNASIFGTYDFATEESVLPLTPLMSGEMSFDGGTSLSGSGKVTGAEDINLASTLVPDQIVGGTYAVSGATKVGRGAILLTSPSKSTIAVWVASASEFFGLDVDATNTQPAILHFEQ
jgi:hypothetical protein